MDKPKSLVEVLRTRAALWRSVSSDLRESDWNGGNAQGLDEAAKLAESYEVRREALEYVFAMLRDMIVRHWGEGMVPMALREAIKAVPPLPEESDGS